MSFLPQLSRAAAAPLASTSRAFTTCAVVCAPKKAAAKPALKKRQGGTYNKNKPSAASGGRIKAGGITLRTTLAKEPADLTDLVQLYPESILPINVGKASVFPRNTYDQLKTFGLPRRLNDELSTGAPASVIRQATFDVVKTLEGAKGGQSKDARYVLTGDRGSGKSMLLVQAVSYALESGWIVLYVPRASKWIDSTSQHVYNGQTQVFDQPTLAADLLSKLLTVNRDRLASVQLVSDVELDGKKYAAGSALGELVAAGAKDARVAPAALEAVLGALAAQTAFPVLLAVDEAQTLFARSAYRAPDYTQLESYHLGVPRLMLEYVSGVRSFSRGALLTALSHSDTRYLAGAEVARGLGLEPRTPITEYTKLDEHHLAHASSGLKRIDLAPGMDAAEAAALFTLYTRKGWASNASDDVFMGGFAAAAGNPRELARGWLQSHQSFIV